MKRIILAGNWKMNLGPEAGALLAKAILTKCATSSMCEVWLAPPFVTIPAVVAAVHGSKVLVGAQNCYSDDSGAFTGEVSPGMLKEIGAAFAIVGHSERRHIFGESSELVAKRAVGVLGKGLQCIFCVGETRDERKQGKTRAVITDQLSPLFRGEIPSPGNLVIAYEPVWAIGTGDAATPADIEDVTDFIAEICKEKVGLSVPVLYGGSVTPDNFGEIIGIGSVSGALVGGASLDSTKFSRMFSVGTEKRE